MTRKTIYLIFGLLLPLCVQAYQPELSTAGFFQIEDSGAKYSCEILNVNYK